MSGLLKFNTLTFDVVGTLIDFERGILEWFRPTLANRGLEKTDEEILTTFADCEDRYQRDAPDKPFTAMLPLIYRDMAARWEVEAQITRPLIFRSPSDRGPRFRTRWCH